MSCSSLCGDALAVVFWRCFLFFVGVVFVVMVCVLVVVVVVVFVDFWWSSSSGDNRHAKSVSRECRSKRIMQCFARVSAQECCKQCLTKRVLQNIPEVYHTKSVKPRVFFKTATPRVCVARGHYRHWCLTRAPPECVSFGFLYCILNFVCSNGH